MPSSGEAAARLLPGFFDAPSGRVFALQTLPLATCRGYILHVPAFAEEMHKARRMTSLAAQRLARDGWHVISVDLYGCGDSGGDFGEATWAGWLADLAWLKQTFHQDTALLFFWWGTRTGALLAAQAAEQAGGDGLLLWQAVGAGKQYLTQFLRMKLAGEAMADAASVALDTRPLKAALAAGEALEVAGYRLNPALAQGLEAAQLPAELAMPVAWLEVASREPAALLPASMQRIGKWQDQGFMVQAEAFYGLPFWQSVEISEVLVLLDASVKALDFLAESAERSAL